MSVRDLIAHIELGFRDPSVTMNLRDRFNQLRELLDPERQLDLWLIGLSL
jgi:hypothetical protein